MKRFLCFIVILTIVCINLCACGSNSTNQNDNKDYEYDTSIITKSEAESRAASALYIKLKAVYLYVDSYDISQTTYSVGSISGSASSGYTVSGTYSLYDKYGNFKERENFSVKVDSDGHTTVTEY